MAKQVQDAYIVAATRTPVGKAPRGMFRNTRPDDLLVHALKSALAQAPGLDPGAVEDVIVGCAMPEAEQGMNVARIGLLLAGFPDTRAGHDDQSLLLVGAAGGSAGGRPHPSGRSRCHDRGRHREHEHDADGRQQDLDERAHLRQGRKHRDRLRHGHHRGESRAAVEGLARGAGSVRHRKPPQRACAASRAANSRTRSRHTRSTRSFPTSPRARFRTTRA